MTIEDIQNAIYQEGSIAVLRKVHTALVNIAKDDPTVAFLADELEEVIIYQEPPSDIPEAVHDFMFSQIH